MAKIAIDGPAGAGKSTISKIVAKLINYDYIDTGAMYRAVTLKALRLGINMEDEASYSFLKDTILDVKGDKIYLDGQDVSDAIRSIEVTNNASTPAKIGIVRNALVDFQRQISEKRNVIMDGRDIGTVVFPNAELKIYLDASLECRAKRRMLEREAKGIYKSLPDTIEEIRVRDYKDSSRVIAPLCQASDAILIETSQLNIDEVVKKVLELIEKRGLSKNE